MRATYLVCREFAQRDELAVDDAPRVVRAAERTGPWLSLPSLRHDPRRRFVPLMSDDQDNEPRTPRRPLPRFRCRTRVVGSQSPPVAKATRRASYLRGSGALATRSAGWNSSKFFCGLMGLCGSAEAATFVGRFGIVACRPAPARMASDPGYGDPGRISLERLKPSHHPWSGTYGRTSVW